MTHDDENAWECMRMHENAARDLEPSWTILKRSKMSWSIRCEAPFWAPPVENSAQISLRLLVVWCCKWIVKAPESCDRVGALCFERLASQICWSFEELWNLLWNCKVSRSSPLTFQVYRTKQPNISGDLCWFNLIHHDNMEQLQGSKSQKHGVPSILKDRSGQIRTAIDSSMRRCNFSALVAGGNYQILQSLAAWGHWVAFAMWTLGGVDSVGLSAESAGDQK